jgi:hypothetical protein
VRTSRAETHGAAPVVDRAPDAESTAPEAERDGAVISKDGMTQRMATFRSSEGARDGAMLPRLVTESGALRRNSSTVRRPEETRDNGRCCKNGSCRDFGRREGRLQPWNRRHGTPVVSRGPDSVRRVRIRRRGPHADFGARNVNDGDGHFERPCFFESIGSRPVVASGSRTHVFCSFSIFRRRTAGIRRR